MSQEAQPAVVNSLFYQKMDDPREREKISQAGTDFLKDRLREASFARKVVPPRNVSRAECQVSLEHDTLVYIDWIEPKSRAMTVTFRGQSDANYVTGKRYAISFFRIASQKHEATEEELLVYPYPITKVIEKNSYTDVQEIEDRQFLLFVELAVQALQLEANGGTATALNASNLQADPVAVVERSVLKGVIARESDTDDFIVYPIQKQDFINLLKLFVGDYGVRLRPDRILMTDADFLDMMSWTVEDFGNKLASEVVVDGFKYTTVLGTKFVRTIKTDILRPGNVYAFTEPNFFGRFLTLLPLKFYIDKEENRIMWLCWETIGMGFGNIAAVRKLELYPGSVTPTAEDTGYELRIPMEEEELGAENNRVAEGDWFPHVDIY